MQTLEKSGVKKIEKKEIEDRVFSTVEYTIEVEAVEDKITTVVLKREKIITQPKKFSNGCEKWVIRRGEGETRVEKWISYGEGEREREISMILNEREDNRLFSSIKVLESDIDKWGVKYVMRVMIEHVKAVAEKLLSPTL